MYLTKGIKEHNNRGDNTLYLTKKNTTKSNQDNSEKNYEINKESIYVDVNEGENKEIASKDSHELLKF